MSAKKRQQTMAKMRREQAVREKRLRKQEKKEAARNAKLDGTALADEPGEDQELSEDERPED
jgi:hypothetical protein